MSNGIKIFINNNWYRMIYFGYTKQWNYWFITFLIWTIRIKRKIK